MGEATGRARRGGRRAAAGRARAAGALGGRARSRCTASGVDLGRPALGRPALGDPRCPQRRPAAVGPAAQRACAGSIRRPSWKGPEAKVGPPDPKIAKDPEVDAAGDSVVKVLSTACGLGVEGSGLGDRPVTSSRQTPTLSPARTTRRSPSAPGRPSSTPQQSTTSPTTTSRSFASPGWGCRRCDIVGEPAERHLRGGARLSRERALHRDPGAAGHDRRGDQPGLLRPRPRQPADDLLSGRRSQRQLRRAGGRRRRRGADDGVRFGARARTARRAASACPTRSPSRRSADFEPTGHGPMRGVELPS